MEAYIKQEASSDEEVISLSSNSSSSSSVDSINPKKKRRMEVVLPVGFLDPIRIINPIPVKEERVEDNSSNRVPVTNPATAVVLLPTFKQFWKAGDYDGCSGINAANDFRDEMDHVRVHPKFLHSNATSHKWALGAFAELLDNALDEKCNGASYVHVDILENMKDKTKMVVVQDNGGGMTPDKMRQCMSLGYSAKSKMANTIGQYGNGFKTSTMRLGADVMVFSRCRGLYGKSSTQSIGLLSYTFLRGTGKEDIVVPMIDYEKTGEIWSKHVKSSSESWHRNLDTIVEWSPYQSEAHLLQQFDFLSEQGTRIIIYNLWDDDLGSPELDFDSDQHDIQLRGDERNEKKIQMAEKYTSSWHFLTYRHSLRSYASILYRRLPAGFHIMIRGKEVEHHDIVGDLMNSERHVYRPAANADMPSSKDPDVISATVTLGFVKDAIHHIDIQGFNVYHKNRLIKPFWRVWNAAGSDGRGVVGVLEANFIEPAHDKQGFERTVALSRLENRLVHFQKTYWSTNCQVIGYAQRRGPKNYVAPDTNASCVEAEPISAIGSNGKMSTSSTKKRRRAPVASTVNGVPKKSDFIAPSEEVAANVHVKSEGNNVEEAAYSASATNMILKLRKENEDLKESWNLLIQELKNVRDQYNSLEHEHQDTKRMIAIMDQEQEQFVSAFAEERSRREEEEENLRRRLKDASDTIHALLKKVKALEGGRS